ncbi:MAG: hypothetical protein KDK36_14320 [Leptospiraceae bacterium]|nr:hypothetical protein [Leptospiraceae bacterium]
MKENEITVVYKWTAQPGKLEELKTIYQEVLKQMQDTEPDALKMNCFISEEENALYVHDLFKDAGALGQHLGTTANQHFSKLGEIATPGPFLFLGDIPEEMKEHAKQMKMGAEFSSFKFGFTRD